jgi:hypothetical protein
MAVPTDTWCTPLDYIGKELVAEMDALERVLDRAHFQRVVALVELVHEHGYEEGLADKQAQWEATLAHFPGIQPAVAVVYAHVSETAAECCDSGVDRHGQPWGRCRHTRAVETAST